jgi:hypothetical protein
MIELLLLDQSHFFLKRNNRSNGAGWVSLEIEMNIRPK